MRRQEETAILPTCDGLCVTASDVGLFGTADDIAYAHPGCPRHDPDAVCGCGNPDRCMSPTHGQISHDEALAIRHAQNPNDPRATAGRADPSLGGRGIPGGDLVRSEGVAGSTPASATPPSDETNGSTTEADQ